MSLTRVYPILLILLILLSNPSPSHAQVRNAPNVAELLGLLPDLLGYEQPMRYLIMLQLSDELRPSGGFLKFLVYVHLEAGQVQAIQAIETGRAEIEGLGAWDWVEGNQRILPPQPIQDYLGLGNWVIRDANWWLDFRDTAQTVQNFWEAAGFSSVDAVVAINDIAILHLIDSLGGIPLADGQVLSGEELANYLLGQFYSNTNDPALTVNQEDIAQALSQELITTLLNLPVSRYPLLLAAGLEEANRNNISIAFNEASLAATFHDFGYDGALRAEGVTDYVYLAESNVSYSKLSQMISYAMDYHVQINANLSLNSALTLRMQNDYQAERRRSGFPSYYYDGARWDAETRSFYRNEGYYGTYTRLALAEAAQNIQFSGFDADAGFSQRLTHLNVLGGYNALERDESQLLSFRWEQAALSMSADNRLIFYVQHQAGLPALDLNFSVNYPPCWVLQDSSRQPDEAGTGFLAWHSLMQADSYFALEFESMPLCE